MNFRWSLLRLLCFLLVLPGWAFAQPVPQWPRHATTGRVEFTGVIPWPTSPLTLEQRQALVRRWYTAKLTEVKPVKQTEWAKKGASYAGLPTLAYLDSVFYSPGSPNSVDSVYDRVTWRLVYKVHLSPTPVGLAYRLSDFECVDIVFDASNEESLEKVLTRYSSELAVFYRRLRRALAGW